MFKSLRKILFLFFLKASQVKEDNSNGNDLEKELQEELDSLNKRDKEFAVLDTGAKYTIFINLESVSSNSVVEAIFEVSPF